MQHFIWQMAIVVAAAALGACGTGDEDEPASAKQDGPAASTGGAPGTGGIAATGGVSAAGVTPSTGGLADANATGGSPTTDDPAQPSGGSRSGGGGGVAGTTAAGGSSEGAGGSLTFADALTQICTEQCAAGCALVYDPPTGQTCVEDCESHIDGARGRCPDETIAYVRCLALTAGARIYYCADYGEADACYDEIMVLQACVNP